MSRRRSGGYEQGGVVNDRALCDGMLKNKVVFVGELGGIFGSPHLPNAHKSFARSPHNHIAPKKEVIVLCINQ